MDRVYEQQRSFKEHINNLYLLSERDKISGKHHEFRGSREFNPHRIY